MTHQHKVNLPVIANNTTQGHKTSQRLSRKRLMATSRVETLFTHTKNTPRLKYISTTRCSLLHVLLLLRVRLLPPFPDP